MGRWEYKRETGAIISNTGHLLHLIYGEQGHVEFPSDVIWQLHKTQPGIVFKLAHTHPPRMINPSARDLMTLKTWAIAFHPFPARLSVITQLKKSRFVEQTFIGNWESKETWITRGKETPRTFEVILESEEEFEPYQGYFDQEYQNVLIERSYKENA